MGGVDKVGGGMRSVLRMLAAAAAVVAFAVAWPVLARVPAASAASNGQWSIYPYRPPGTVGSGRANFDFAVTAGETVSDAVTLANFTDHAISFDVYAADAYNVKLGGGFALRGYGQRNTGVGSWVHLPRSVATDYRLPADQTVEIPFSVTVPPGTPSGDTAGGIVALDVTPAPRGRGHIHFAIQRGVGVRIYMHVLGRRYPGLAVTTISTASSQPAFGFLNATTAAAVRFSVADTGNTIFAKVKATVTATDLFGRTVKTFPPRYLSAVLPKSTEVIYEPLWKPLPIAGPVTFHVHLSATTSITAAASGGTLWVVPWTLAGTVVVVLAAVWYVLRRRRRQRRRGGGGGSPPPGGPGGPAEPAGAPTPELAPLISSSE